MEVTIDAGDLFYVKIHSSEIKKLRLRDSQEVWMSFPREAVIVLNGTF